jgi:hypothetical protein
MVIMRRGSGAGPFNHRVDPRISLGSGTGGGSGGDSRRTSVDHISGPWGKVGSQSRVGNEGKTDVFLSHRSSKGMQCGSCNKSFFRMEHLRRHVSAASSFPLCSLC